MTRIEIIAAVCVDKQKRRDAKELQQIVLKLWEDGYYTAGDYERFCTANQLGAF